MLNVGCWMVNALTHSHSHHPQWSPERDPEDYDDQGPLRETTDRGKGVSEVLHLTSIIHHQTFLLLCFSNHFGNYRAGGFYFSIVQL